MSNMRPNQDRYVTTLIQDHADELHYREPVPSDETALRRLADTIRDGRERMSWTQDDLAAASGVSRPTIQRYEQAKTQTPEADKIRALFLALKLDPRRIPVILGYVTAGEMGLPAEPARVFDRSIEDVIEILQDPTVDPTQKAEWVEYLRYRARQRVDDDAGRNNGRRAV